MKGFKRLVCALLALALLGIGGLALADDVYAVDGEELVLFDQDGVKLYLTGDVEESGRDEVFIYLKCVIENNREETISVQYTGVVNGWNLDSTYIMNGATNIPAGTKSKSDIWFTSDKVEAKSFEEVETMDLVFTVKNDDNEKLFEVDTGAVHFHTEGQPAAEEAPAEEAPAEGEAAEEAAAEEAPAAADGEAYVREVTLPAREYVTLSEGSRGDDAKALQQALIDQGFLDGGADGIYGKGTAAAVKAFQESAGLEATGVADAETQRKLFGDEGGETVTITVGGTWKSDFLQMEGLFVNDAYEKEDYPGQKLLYVFFSASTQGENFSVPEGYTNITINDTNSYEGKMLAGVCDYMGSYYYGTRL